MRRYDLRHLHDNFYDRMGELIESGLAVGEVGIFLFEVGDFSSIQKSADVIKQSGHDLMNSLKFNEVDWTIVVKKVSIEEIVKRREEAKIAAKIAEEKRIEAEKIATAKAKAKAESDAKKKAEKEAKEKAEAEAKAKEEAEKAIADAKAKFEAKAEAKVKQEAEAKAKSEAEAKVKQEAEAKAKSEAEAKAKQEAEAKATPPKKVIAKKAPIKKAIAKKAPAKKKAK